MSNLYSPLPSNSKKNDPLQTSSDLFKSPKIPKTPKSPNRPLFIGFFRPFGSLSFDLTWGGLVLFGTIFSASPLFMLAFAFFGVLLFDQTASGAKKSNDFSVTISEMDIWDSIIRYLWINWVFFLSTLPACALVWILNYCGAFNLTGAEPFAEEARTALIIFAVFQGALLLFAPILALSETANETSPFNVWTEIKDVVSTIFGPLKKTWVKYYSLNFAFFILSVLFFVLASLFSKELAIKTDSSGFKIATFYFLFFLRGAYMACATFFYFRLLGRLARILELYFRDAE